MLPCVHRLGGQAMVAQLSEQRLDLEEVEYRMQKAGVRLQCSLCGQDSGFDHWLIADELVSVVPWGKQSYSFDGGYPSVLVACRRCGQTILFNAQILGLT